MSLWTKLKYNNPKFYAYLFGKIVGNFCVPPESSSTEETLYNSRRKQRRNRTTFTLQQVKKSISFIFVKWGIFLKEVLKCLFIVGRT